MTLHDAGFLCAGLFIGGLFGLISGVWMSHSDHKMAGRES